MKKRILFGTRIPRDFFITKGRGESNITVHAGSFHLALKDAGVECYNHMVYSSVLPGIAREVPLPKTYAHGAVLETIQARADVTAGKRATAGIIIGWLHDKKTKKKYGGLVCEYGGSKTEPEARKHLQDMIKELYFNGFSEKYQLGKVKIMIESFVPRKKYGTTLVIIGFVNYVYPILGEEK